jgi:acyl-CoA synthetase (AMP-forming)/AMP-acid ligase II
VLTISYTSGSAEPPLRDDTIGGLLAWAAESAPDRVALITGTREPSASRQWTYAELHAEAQRTARALTRRFAPGERVAVWAPNIPEWIILECGAAMAGLVLMTVNPAFRASEVEYVLNQSRAAGIVVIPEFRGNPMFATVEEVRPRCPELREVIRFDQWDEFVAVGDDPTIGLPDIDPLDAVMIQYTSGTTGFPKGAVLHHRGLINNGAHVFERAGVRAGDVTLTAMPLFHTAGCVLCVLGAAATLSTQVLVEAFEPGLVLQVMERHQVNALIVVPTMLVALLEHPDFATTDLSAVRTVSSGGSTVPAHLVTTFEEKLGATFTIVFGQTECSPIASMTSPSDSVADKGNTIGTPMAHVEVKVVDPATGATVRIGQIGEYCTRGYHVMHGYFENPDATAAAIDADGWLHTGDLCMMDERGYLTVEGRLKDMIIRGGENIYPRELEEVLFAHPAIGEVAVVGIPDDKWGEQVGAFIRPAPGMTIEKAELFEYVRGRLAPHKTPRHWYVVEQFPVTGSGKIQKYKLREMSTTGALEEI